MASKNKRVLLINPAKQDYFPVERIHMGLSIIGTILASDGHEVKLIDYTYLRNLKQTIKTPNIEEVIYEFKPDVIGITVFTYFCNECQTLIEEISRCCDVPVILGGPHFIAFPKDFSDDNRISYIVRGEAEMVISDLIRAAERQCFPVFIDGLLSVSEEIPAINLDVAYGSQYLVMYQIQLSRGCPYNCSFCNIKYIAGRKMRARNLETCLSQIVEAKRSHPSIKIITITDDCPNFNKERFKQFLRMFIKAKIGCNLSVDHMRANLLDEEMIQLYKAAGGKSICLGVESGHPGVFKLTDKGESLEQIIWAAKLIRKYKLDLGLCFVIGLPQDSPKRYLYSVRLGKSLKPSYIFWNMCIPWPGTKVRQWYERYGKITGEPRNFSTLIDPKLNFKEPICESSSFPRKDMIKAWLMANLETDRRSSYLINRHSIGRLIFLAHKYKIYRSAAIYCLRYFFLCCKGYALGCKHYILRVK